MLTPEDSHFNETLAFSQAAGGGGGRGGTSQNTDRSHKKSGQNLQPSPL